VEASGSYLNFFFNREEFARLTLSAIAGDEDYGASTEGAGKTVLVDFSSPNIAKPLGIGHLRSTVIGNCLALVFEKLGYRALRVNHLGDWGTQFGAIIYAFKQWGSEQALQEDAIGHLYELYVRFHREADADASLEEEARGWFRRLEEREAEVLDLWQRFVQLSLQKLNNVYRTLGVGFDHYVGESFYEPLTAPLLEELREKGLVKEDEGALIFDLSAEGLPPCLLRKSDGTTLYATRDLAAAIYRKREFDFDRMLYVVGAPQSLHFQQVFKMLELMGHTWAKDCVHVAFGLIRFGAQKMSTRAGTLLLLEDVYREAFERTRKMIEEKNPDAPDKDEIARRLAVGALFFADLKNDRIQDVEFDWDEILNLEGDTGPYIHYAYVRISSILRKAASGLSTLDSRLPSNEKTDAPSCWAHLDSLDFSSFQAPEERVLISQLARYPDAIEAVAQAYKPSFLARYLLSLAQNFSVFYHKCPVLQAERQLRDARLLLVHCVATVIKDGLRLLGIEAVDRM
jgi:arginyl-tRNA synthetase